MYDFSSELHLSLAIIGKCTSQLLMPNANISVSIQLKLQSTNMSDINSSPTTHAVVGRKFIGSRAISCDAKQFCYRNSLMKFSPTQL